MSLSCADQSEVQISVLAADLIRVRVSYQKPMAGPDHSWAIAKTTWEPTLWTLRDEPPVALHLVTDELEVVVNRQPLLIEFRDRRTGRLINADQRPMAFDPKSGIVAAAKRLGVDEHFYGLGEKAARLDKRRDQFTMWTSDTPGYVEGTDPLYQSIPFYIGWESGAAYGVFFDNSYRTRLASRPLLPRGIHTTLFWRRRRNELLFFLGTFDEEGAQPLRCSHRSHVPLPPQ